MDQPRNVRLLCGVVISIDIGKREKKRVSAELSMPELKMQNENFLSSGYAIHIF